jgi:hypothetical protein
MRTTLAIDDDVLAAARAIARQKRRTVGQVLSDLAQQSLHPTATPTERNGIPLLPVRRPNAIVTLDVINALRDEAG